MKRTDFYSSNSPNIRVYVNQTSFIEVYDKQQPAFEYLKYLKRVTPDISKLFKSEDKECQKLGCELLELPEDNYFQHIITLTLHYTDCTNPRLVIIY